MAGDGGPNQAERSFERTLALALYFKEEARPITLDELTAALPEYAAEKENTSTTKLRRDCDILEAEAGIVIGWSHEEQAYVLDKPFFTPAERLALVDAARAIALNGLDASGTGEDTTAGPLIGTEVDARSAVVAIRVPAILDDLQELVAKRQCVRFTYNGKDRTVQPWRIGQWRDGWYLIALETDGTKPKRFALDRIQPSGTDDTLAAVGRPGAFTVPEDVDWDEQFSLDPNAWGPDPEIGVRIRVADALRPLLADAFDDWRPIERIGDDIVVEIPARHYESTIIRLLSFGRHVRVLGPPEFVERMRAWLAPQVEAR